MKFYREIIFNYFVFAKIQRFIFTIKQIMTKPGAPGPSTPPNAKKNKGKEPSGLTTAEKRQKLSDARKATMNKRILILTLKAVDGTTLAYNVTAARSFLDRTAIDLTSEEFTGFMNILKYTDILQAKDKGAYKATLRDSMAVNFPPKLAYGRSHIVDNETEEYTVDFLSSVDDAFMHYDNIKRIDITHNCNDSEEDQILNLMVTHS